MGLRIGVAGLMASAALSVKDIKHKLLGTSGSYFVPASSPNGGYKNKPSRKRKKKLSRRSKFKHGW